MRDTNKKLGRPKQSLTILCVLLLSLTLLLLASCKPAAKPAGHNKNAKKASESLQRKVLADAEHDIAVIATVQDDPRVLLQAVSGKALAELEEQIKELKEEGLVKIREYDDLKLSFGTYQKKVAGVTAQFTDNSRIVKIDSGQPLAVARAEKVKLYLGLAEDDGRWKIITIMTGLKDN